MKLIEMFFTNIFSPIVVTVLAPVALSIYSKIVKGNSMAILTKIPFAIWIVFGSITILWWVFTLVFKRLKKIKDYQSDYHPSISSVYSDWEIIGHLDYVGAKWNIKRRSAISFNINTDIEVELPPRCPKCETEIEEMMRFWGGFKWKCVRCNNILKNRDDFYRESKRVLKIVKRDIEAILNKKQQ